MALWASLGVSVARRADEEFNRRKNLMKVKENHKTSHT